MIKYVPMYNCFLRILYHSSKPDASDLDLEIMYVNLEDKLSHQMQSYSCIFLDERCRVLDNELTIIVITKGISLFIIECK